MKKLVILILFFVSFLKVSYASIDDESKKIIKKNYYENQYAKSHKGFGGSQKKGKKNKKKAEKWISEVYPNLGTECKDCEKIGGFVQPNSIDIEIYRMAGIMPGPPTSKDTKVQKKRGMFRTGLKPKFYNDAKCATCDDCWAIDYSYKREGNPAYHKGRDLPKPFDTPVLAMADGVVVGLFENIQSRKGVEVVLRHKPEQTGLPFYTYTQYSHFNKWPLNLKIGQKIKTGDVLGPNGNSGKRGKKTRRPALHFAVMYSKSPEWSFYERGFLVKDGYWMDPVAFLRNEPPYENKKVKKLKDKKVLVGYQNKQGKIVPEGSKKIWPFACN